MVVGWGVKGERAGGVAGDACAWLRVCICKVMPATSQVQLRGAEGMPPSVGVVQVSAGPPHAAAFGSVCGMNLAAADVVCRQLGYEYGSVSTSPCGSYGGEDVCSATGTPVAMQNLKCTGGELDVNECAWEEPTAQCADHRLDSVVYCSYGAERPREGAVRLISYDGAPSIDGEGRLELFRAGSWTSVCRSGLTDGARSVACKALGYVATTAGAEAAVSSACNDPGRGLDFCGGAAPRISNMGCSGHESGLLACPYIEGDDVYCAAEARQRVHRQPRVCHACTARRRMQLSGALAMAP